MPFVHQDSATRHTADISCFEDSGLVGCDTVPLVKWFLLLQKMKSVHYFKMLGTTHPMAQCHVPGDWNHQLRHCEILKIRSCMCCVQSVFGNSNK